MRKKSARSNANRKIKKWMDNPCCYWCNEKTIIFPAYTDGKRNPSHPLEATIDHIKSKLDGMDYSNEIENTVLSCRKCNQERNFESKIMMPYYKTFHPQEVDSALYLLSGKI